MWHRVACETAQSFLLSPTGSTLNQKAMAEARARTRETSAVEKTRPPWAWTQWETTIWERSHAANADAEFEIHQRGGGRSPPCTQCIACHQNSPPLLCATGCAWCSAEPRTAVGLPRERTARLRSVQPPRRSGGETVRATGSAVCEGHTAIHRGHQLRERARRPLDYGTTFRDTCGPRAFSHILQRT